MSSGTDELDEFLKEIQDILVGAGTNPNFETKRRVISALNEFLFQSYDGIGTTEALDDEFDYFSDFHRFWEAHHEDVIGIEIAAPSRCQEVASVLDRIRRTQGASVFGLPAVTKGLTREQVALVRFFTANQDFRESIPLDIYEKFARNPDRLDTKRIAESPDNFISFLGVTGLSQNDKRVSFTKKAAEFLLANNISPFQLAELNENNAERIRSMLESNQGIGYKRKKADMFIRDMYVLDVWPKLSNIDAIDVASDRNTMRVSLRLGLVTSKIPLLSSFLDIFSYQYGLVDVASAEAWRAVWKEWRTLSPETSPHSPAMMDYMLYRMGQTCFGDLVFQYRCTDNNSHVFYRSSRRTKKCEVCGESASPEEGILTALVDIGSAEIPTCPFERKCHGTCQFHDLVLQDAAKVSHLFEGQGYKLNTVMAIRAINSVATKRGAIGELLVTNY